MTPVSLPIPWRLPLYPSVRVSSHITGGRYQELTFRFYCLSRFRPSTVGLLSGTLSPSGGLPHTFGVEYAPEEPFTIFPRSLFDLHQFALEAPVVANAFRWQGERCDLYSLPLEFRIDDPVISWGVFHLQVAIPQRDPIPLKRALLGANTLRTRRADITITHRELYHLSQQYPAGRCGTLSLYP
jgi:hypothetical protein